MKIKNLKLKIISIAQWCFATLPRKIISCLVIAGILLSSIWLLLLKPKPVEADWWDEDWLYRRAVVVTNNTTAETDVYIKFDNVDSRPFINTSGDNFQADCGDLRFTKRDGTQLDYYIVSGCGGASTIVHVKLDMLQTGDQTIYFYYGNPSADNGFIGTDFSTHASDYSIGAIGEEKKGLGPVLWLKFDEGYGTTAFDSSEQNNDGTLEGDPTWTDSGKFNKALNFDGDGDYVDVTIDSSSVVSYSYWARDQLGSWHHHVDVNGTQYKDGVADSFDDFVGPNSSTTFYIGTKPQTTPSDVSGLVLWLDADDLSGNDGDAVATWSDKSGEGNDATQGNADYKPKLYNSVINGHKIVRFDGSDDYLDVGTIRAAEGGFRAFVVSKRDSASGSAWQRILSIYNGTGYDYVAPGWQLVGAQDGSGNPESYVTDVRTRNQSSGYVIDYLRIGAASYTSGGYHWGDVAEIIIYDNDISSDEVNEIKAYLAVKYNITGYSFNGTIDEVKVYPYARTAVQIKRDYNKGAAARIGRDDSWLTDGLVGYWKMDEDSWSGAANEVEDSSGAGNHGVRSGNATTTGTAKFGKAGTFDGTGDYVDVADDSSLNMGSGDFSLSAWFKTTTTVSGTIVGKGGTSAGGKRYILFFLGQTHGYNGNVQIYLDDDANPGSLVSSADTYDDGEWHHAVAIRDGNNLRLYVDGNAETPVDISSLGDIDSVRDFTIGSIYNEGPLDFADFFDGEIDDVRVYNRVLSEFEIQRLYDWGPPPVAHYKFDEGSGSSANDSSENANTGTITDATWKNAAECKYGNCLDFDGDGDYVDTGYKPPYTARTVAYWIKYNDVSVEQRIGIHETSKRFYVGISGSNNYYWGLGDESRDTITHSFQEGQWYFVVLTADGSNGRYYVNGVEVDSSTYSQSSQSQYNFYIGARKSSDVTSYVNGQIDDVKIYNYVRTPKQIIEDMMGGRPGITETTSSPGAMAGYWKFDEGFGIIAYDASGRDNDLDFSGPTESYTMAGKFGKAWDGDGSKYLSIADDPDFDFTETEDFSISGWFKHSAIASANDYIIAKHESGGGYKIYMDSDGDIAFAIDDDGTWDTADVIGNDQARDYDDNAWHYFAAVKRGTSSIRLYVDGREIDNDTDLAETETLVNTDLLYVGIDADETNAFDGELDEIKIYRFALSPEEILLDYNKGKSVIMGAVGTELQGAADQKPAFGTSGSQLNTDHPLADGLVGIWIMNEGTGDEVADLSGNGNHGTFQGTAPSWSSGKFGSAVLFPGNDEYINCGSAPVFDAMTALTLISWIYVDTAQEGAIISFTNNHQDRVYIKENGTYVRVFNDIDDVGIGHNSAANSFSVGGWHQVAWTYDNEGISQIYIDGAPSGSSQDYVPTIATLINGFITKIGMSFDGNFFRGLIDHIMIYNRALSANEIKWLYSEPFAMLNLPTVPSFSQNRAYCPPGHVGLCSPPVAEYKFDERTGATTYDTSANTNNGTITGATWKGSGDCKYNGCLSFDGTGDYVNIPDNSGLTFTDFTISAWIYPTSDASTVMMLSSYKDNSPQDYYALGYITGDDYYYITTRDTAGNSSVVQSTVGMQTNEWTHLVGVVDFDGNFSIYINGSFNNSSASIAADDFNPEDGFNIGNDVSLSYPFDGQIDDVKIFDYALSQEQIAWVYNKGSPVGQWKFDEAEGPITYNSTLNDGGKLPGLRLDTDHSLSNGIVGLWLMNENTSNKIYDLSGNGNTGTLIGGDVTWVSGKYGPALDFPGTAGDGVDCGSGSSLYTPSALTISAWIKATDGNLSHAQADTIVSRGYYNNVVGYHFYGTGNRLYVALGDGSTRFLFTYSGVLSWDANTWYHVVFTYDGSNYVIYRDSVSVVSSSVEGTISDVSPLRIGLRYSSSNDFFHGLIDHVMMWNRGLSATEIAQLYAEPFAMISDTGASLITGADWSSGKYNSALDFNGDTDVVTVAVDKDIDLNSKTGYSVCGWINPDSDGQDSEGEWFSKGNSYIRVDTESGSTVEVSALFDLVGETDASLNTTQTIPIGSWSHICTTWKNDDDDELTIYINGINAGSSTNGSGAPFDDSASHLNIGGDDDKNFDGDIDEVTIYNYELTSQQVKLDYNQGSALRFGD